MSVITSSVERSGTTATATEVLTKKPAGLDGVGLYVMLVGLSLSIIDFFIVNVALPTMARDLHAGSGALELVVSGYGVVFATGLVLGGRLGDAFGRRRLFTWGMVGFTIASAVCGVAPDITVLVVARLVQGGAAAMMVPQVLGTIQASTSGEAKARAISRYGATAGVSMVVGQVIGGALIAANIAHTGWRPVFLVNMPIGIAVLIGMKVVPATRSERPQPIDRTGTVLLAVALAGVLVVLSFGRILGWPAWLWSGLVVAASAAVLLARTERRIETEGRMPLLPPSILRVASMRLGLSAAIPFFTGFGSFMFVYALASQDDLGLGAFTAGIVLAPAAVAFFCATLLTPQAVARFGTRVIPGGAVVQATGLAMLAAIVATQWPHPAVPLVIVAFVIIGGGQGLVAPCLFRVILADVPGEAAGAGSGVLTTTQQTSLAMGATLGGTLFLGLGSTAGQTWAGVAVLGAQIVAALVVLVVSPRLPTIR